jgi:hypothetical protein
VVRNASAAVADGQWHSFGGQSSGRLALGSGSGSGLAGRSGFNNSRFGQGASLAASSLGASRFGTSFRGGSSGTFGNRGFGEFGRGGLGGFGRRGWGGGCVWGWGLGFGWGWPGWGWGFGWPFWGISWGWDPYWYDPFWTWNSYGSYGGYAPGYDYGAGDPASEPGYSDPGYANPDYPGPRSSSGVFQSPFNTPAGQLATPVNRNLIFPSPLTPPTAVPAGAPMPAPEPAPQLQTGAQPQLQT